MPAAAAPVGCAISFSDELEGFSFFFSFTFDFLLFGRSYSTDRGKKAVAQIRTPFRHLSARVTGWRSAPTRAHSLTGYHAVFRTRCSVFHRHPNTNLLLFSSSLRCSSFVFFILTTN